MRISSCLHFQTSKCFLYHLFPHIIELKMWNHLKTDKFIEGPIAISNVWCSKPKLFEYLDLVFQFIHFKLLVMKITSSLACFIVRVFDLKLIIFDLLMQVYFFISVSGFLELFGIFGVVNVRFQKPNHWIN